MEISTATETVTVTKYSLILTEAELTAALVDPTDLQQALRSARGAQARGRHGKSNFTIGRKGKKEKAPRAPKGQAGKGGFAKSPCPECKQPVAASQMKTHRMRKHGLNAVDVAKSSASN